MHVGANYRLQVQQRPSLQHPSFRLELGKDRTRQHAVRYGYHCPELCGFVHPNGRSLLEGENLAAG